MQARSSNTEALSPAMDLRIVRTLARIQADPSRRLTVTQIAAEMGLSCSRFEHLFKQSTGESFKNRLRRLCLLKARALLSDERLSIKEVGFRCGYSDQASFSRDFKRLFRTSPSHLRHSRFRQQIADLINSFILTNQ